MGKRILKTAGIWCAGTFFLAQILLCQQTDSSKGAPETVYAAKGETTEEPSSYGLDEEIQRSSQQIGGLEEEQKQLQEDLEKLEQKKEDILAYIEELDEKSGQLTAKIDSSKIDIKEIKGEIKELRAQKKETQQQKNIQYDTMKKRIKYMYENGQGGYLELLLGAKSLSELFNWSEYVYKVSDYDRNLFQRYQAVCDKLDREKEQLDEELEKLKALREDLQFRRDSIALLSEKKAKQLEEYQQEIEETGAQLDSAVNALKAQEDELERLMKAKRKQVEKENKKSEAAAPAAEPQVSASGYQWPLPVSGSITSYFGYREAPTAGASTYHKGIDIAVPVGTGVLAAREGTVVTAAYSASAGYYVALYHGGGVYTYYMHCAVLNVSAGDSVEAGEVLALSGNTGISTGPHLHFAIYANGDYVNPLIYCESPGQ